MAVTLYRQVGKGKARRYQKVNLGRGRRPADLTVPTFCGTRWLTALVHGKRLATISMRRSTPRSASRHTSKLLMRMFRIWMKFGRKQNNFPRSAYLARPDLPRTQSESSRMEKTRSDLVLSES
jgi:hypothetical protein